MRLPRLYTFTALLYKVALAGRVTFGSPGISECSAPLRHLDPRNANYKSR